MVLLEYNTKVLGTIGIDGTAWENGNKPRGKLDSNLDSVIGIVITLEIAKGKLMYGRGICKNREGYTRNKTYYYTRDSLQRDSFQRTFPYTSALPFPTTSS